MCVCVCVCVKFTVAYQPGSVYYPVLLAVLFIDQSVGCEFYKCQWIPSIEVTIEEGNLAFLDQGCVLILRVNLKYERYLGT